MDNLQIAGKLGKPHGIKGFLVIHSHYDIDWENLNTIFIEINNHFIPYQIEQVKFLPTKTVIKLKLLSSINDAKKLTNKDFYVSKNFISKDDISIYINYTVLDANNNNFSIGIVVDYLIQETTTCLILSNNNKKEILLPFNDAFIKSIDNNKKIIYYKAIEGMY